MGFKDLFNKLNEKRKLEKEQFNSMEREERFRHKLEEKQKSPMQKEHEIYQREKEKDKLKQLVTIERKERNERMKKLSDPFNKGQAFRERNDLMGGGMKLR